MNVSQGQSAESDVTIVTLNGFSGSISLQSASNSSGLPLGPSKVVTHKAGDTSSFTLTFLPTQSTIAQGHTVNVSGLSSFPSRSHLVQVSVTVSPKGSIGVVPVDKLAVLAQRVPPPLALLGGVFSAAVVWNETKKRQPGASKGRGSGPP